MNRLILENFCSCFYVDTEQIKYPEKSQEGCLRFLVTLLKSEGAPKQVIDYVCDGYKNSTGYPIDIERSLNVTIKDEFLCEMFSSAMRAMKCSLDSFTRPGATFHAENTIKSYLRSKAIIDQSFVFKTEFHHDQKREQITAQTTNEKIEEIEREYFISKKGHILSLVIHRSYEIFDELRKRFIEKVFDIKPTRQFHSSCIRQYDATDEKETNELEETAG